MQPAKVPQHLELGDVVAWGLGAVDLLFVVGGALCGWWLHLAVPNELAGVALAAPLALAGLALGVVRIADCGLRTWLWLAMAFALRPRLLVTGSAE